MKRIVLFTVVLLTSLATIYAKKFDIKNVVVGGQFGFNITNGQTAINVSPQLGYRFNQYLTAGAGVGYSYYSYKDVFNQKYSQNYLGMNIYGQVNPIKYVALKVQPEVYQMWGQNIETQTIPCLLVGAGATIPTGNNGGVSMMFYYDVAQNDFSPYGKDIFYSIGYTFGF